MSDHPEREICALADLGEPGAREFFVGAGDWPFHGFVVRIGDEVCAFVNVCPHRQHPLNLGPDDFLVPGQRLLRCSSHGAVFEPGSGLCIAGPCAGRSLRRLPCRVADEKVLVRAPDRRQPDPQIGDS